MITENLTIGKNDYEVRLEDLNQIDLEILSRKSQSLQYIEY